MARVTDLNKSLKEKIASLSTDKERLDDIITEQEGKVKSDFATETISVLRSILSESEGGDVDTLEANVSRIDQLKTYIEQANLGKREKTTLLGATDTVRKYLSKNLSEKNSVLNSATNIIRGWTDNAGSMVESVIGTAFGNDPLINLATRAVTKTGGFLKNIVGRAIESKKNQKNIKNAGIKQDASSLLGKAVRVARPPKSPGIIPPEMPGPMGGFGTPLSDQPAAYGDGVEAVLNTISIDVKSILSSLQDSQSMMQDLIEDISLQNIENEKERRGAARDAAREAAKNTIKQSGSAGGLFSGLLGSFSGKGIASMATALLKGALVGAVGVATNPVTLIAGSIIWNVIEGIKGWLKADEWGVSKISGTIGGVLAGSGKGVVNAFVNAGRYALTGATIGLMTGGPIGAAVGGLVGAMIGGIMGYVGGQKVAEFFDDLGNWILETFTNGFLVIKNFFLDMWGSIREMFLNVGDAIDVVKISILDWITKQLIAIMQADPTGLATDALNPVAQGLIEKRDSVIQNIEARKGERRQIEIEKEERDVYAEQVRQKQEQRRQQTAQRRAQSASEQTESEPMVVDSKSGIPTDIKVSRSGATVKPFQGDQKSFYETMYKTLLEEATKAGVKNPEAVARLGAAQSSLETGYGKHLAGGNNYFGIKDFTKKNQGQQTKEFINGKWVTIKDSFRSYGSMRESAADYIKFLQKNKRYANVLNANNVESAIAAQAASGYATDPGYGAKLTQITQKGMSSVTNSDRPSVQPQITLVADNASKTPEIFKTSVDTRGVANRLLPTSQGMSTEMAKMSTLQSTAHHSTPVIVNQNIDASSTNTSSSTEKPQASAGGPPQPDARGLAVLVSLQ